MLCVIRTKTWQRGSRGSLDDPFVAILQPPSPAICIRLSLSARLSLFGSAALAQVLIGVKKKCIAGMSLGVLRLRHCVTKRQRRPLVILATAQKKKNIIISLLRGHRALTSLCDSFTSVSFACCLWKSPLIHLSATFVLIYCFCVELLLSVFYLRIDIASRASISVPVAPSLPPSVHPSTHLAEVRSGRPRRGEPSGARDGATAGAQSDKERQIIPLTRAIHHLFIPPSPLIPRFLHTSA